MTARKVALGKVVRVHDGAVQFGPPADAYGPGIYVVLRLVDPATAPRLGEQMVGTARTSGAPRTTEET